MRLPAGIRARTTVVTVSVLAAALVLGGLALAVLFASGRTADVDARLRAESAQLTALLAGGQLPTTLPAPAGLSAQVVDGQGDVLAASPGTSRLLPVVAVGTPRTRAPATTDDSTLTEGRVRVVQRAVDGPTGAPVTVLVALPLTDVDEAVAALRRAVLVVVPVAVLAGGLATWAAVGAALRPVDRLRAAAQQVLDVRTPVAPQLPQTASGDELERLTATLNAMLTRLHAADVRQRAFVADAAHELRSPLASALLQLEVAVDLQTGELQADRPAASPAEQPDLVAGALADVERLRRLVEDLLLLARLDAGEPRPVAPVDLSTYADRAGPPVLVLVDPDAVQHVVDNLRDNARRHARSRVCTTVRTEGAYGVLLVDDDGGGIDPAHRERVFERWARLDDGRGRDAGGAGLGLSIARALAEGAGGGLTADEGPLGGARLVLRLPLAPDLPLAP